MPQKKKKKRLYSFLDVSLAKCDLVKRKSVGIHSSPAQFKTRRNKVYLLNCKLNTLGTAEQPGLSQRFCFGKNTKQLSHVLSQNPCMFSLLVMKNNKSLNG